MSIRAGSDIGGTFTDVITFDSEQEQIVLAKVLTTGTFTDGAIQGLTQTVPSLAAIDALVHGSTVVINTLLERTGSRTALLTTKGFRDVYEIGRVNRPDAYNLRFSKHRPLVERRLRLEIDERTAPGFRSEVDPASVEAAIERLREEQVDAVAIAFLHAFADPTHEQQVKAAIQAALPEVYVTASHEVSREYREFERTSTVVANAYVGHRMARYLDEFESRLAERDFDGGLSLMQSNGGLSTVPIARDTPVTLVESGPAAGVIGAAALAAELGINSLVAFDMGGTTAKAGVVIDGLPRIAHEYFLGGYGDGLPLQVPVMDIHEVGTGGGSLAEVSEYGELHVGPRSAGSIPGPAAYGLGGTRPTITDANVVLRRLHPDAPLSGGLRLDATAAEAALQTEVCDKLGLSLEHAAAGILDIAVASMSHAISAVTVQRGIDPSLLALCAYGGAGPLHASRLARACGIAQVIIPPMAGVFSAYGMLFSDDKLHRARTEPTLVLPVNATRLAEIAEAVAADVRAATDQSSIVLEYSADMRYLGQEHTVSVPFVPSELDEKGLLTLRERFDELHLKVFSHAAPENRVESVTVRVIGRIPQDKPRFPSVPASTGAPEPLFRAAVYLDRSVGWQEVPFFSRPTLGAGDVIEGPAIVVEETCSTVLLSGDRAVVDATGSLLVAIGK